MLRNPRCEHSTKLQYPRKPRRPYRVHTGKVCNHPMPIAKLPCVLLQGHYGNHRSHRAVWWCDSCGKPQAGAPAARNPDHVSICFMCQEVW